MSRPQDLLDLLEARLGWRAGLDALRGMPLDGPPSWARVPGTVFLAALGLQVLTGIALASFYAPGTTSAWGSVFYLEERVVLGSVLRGLHAFGASAVVSLLVLHVVCAGLRRAYRAPREVAWLAGLLIVPVILGFALTGYLLPWDQKGYWATQVATGIMRGTPLVGGLVAKVFQGGPDLGNLTLTRFYALHTLVLPMTLGVLLVLHLHALRKAAPTNGERWWPRQAARDGLVVAFLGGLLLTLATLRGAGLEAPADPTSDYPPRPEWFFAPLRQLLMLAPEPWGSLVIPGAVGFLIAALPFLDRTDRPRPGLPRLALLLPAGLALLLGAKAYVDDAGDADFQARRAVAESDAALAIHLAREQGIPSAGPVQLLTRHPPRWGAQLFALHCIQCHPLDGRGGDEAPDLTGYLSPDWLMAVVRDPRAPHLFGNTPIDGMDPLPQEAWSDLPDLASFLRSLDPSVDDLVPARVEAGEVVFDAQECWSCHSLDDEPTDMGPSLGGYGSEEWLLRFLRDPGATEFYGDVNEMPAYGEELSDDELRALVAFLRTLDEPLE